MGTYIASVEDHLILPARVRLPLVDERSLVLLGRSLPSPVPIRLLIDTGSKRSTLIPDIVTHLNPDFFRSATIVTPVGSLRTDLVWVCLEFPEAGLAPFARVPVARHPMPPSLAQFHGLFGRDLLSQMHFFEYQGRLKRYLLRDSPGWFDWLRRWL
jgi:hypothetical protein